MAENNGVSKNNYKIACFGCDFWYDCKYYRNQTWIWWIFNHPEEGCPAIKYPYDSIFYAIELEKKKKKEEREREMNHKPGYFAYQSVEELKTAGEK